MPKLNINDQSIYYEVHGKPADVPLVLIHGLGGDLSMWSSVLDNLLQKQQIIMLDNRGSGQTSVPSKPYSIKDLAHDLLALLQYLKVDKVNIIGSSMGGIVAQEFAINYPQQINKLILCSSLTRLKTRTERLILTTARFFELDQYEDTLNSILTNAFGDKFLANKQLVQKQFEQMKANPFPQSTEGFNGQLNALRNADTRDQLHKITAQTLIIAGTRDILSLSDDAAELSAIPKSEVVFIPEVAHQAQIENPEKFLQLVNAFLDR